MQKNPFRIRNLTRFLAVKNAFVENRVVREHLNGLKAGIDSDKTRRKFFKKVESIFQ